MKSSYIKRVLPLGTEIFNGNIYEILQLEKESTRGSATKKKIIHIRQSDRKGKNIFLNFADVGFSVFDKLWEFPDGAHIEIEMKLSKEVM